MNNNELIKEYEKFMEQIRGAISHSTSESERSDLCEILDESSHVLSKLKNRVKGVAIVLDVSGSTWGAYDVFLASDLIEQIQLDRKDLTDNGSDIEKKVNEIAQDYREVLFISDGELWGETKLAENVQLVRIHLYEKVSKTFNS